MSEADANMKLNGSVNLLADAMRKVFLEGMESVHDAIKGDIDAVNTNMGAMEGRLNDHIDQTNKRIDTTNSNMQVQFSEQEKKIAAMLKDR